MNAQLLRACEILDLGAFIFADPCGWKKEKHLLHCEKYSTKTYIRPCFNNTEAQQILRFYFGTFVFNIVMKKTPFRFPSCEWNGRSNFRLLPRIKIKAILLLHLQVNVLTETNMPEKCYVSSWRSFLSQFKDISIIPPNRSDFF